MGKVTLFALFLLILPIPALTVGDTYRGFHRIKVSGKMKVKSSSTRGIMAMKNVLTKLTTALAALALAASVVSAAPSTGTSQPTSTSVRKALATLPYYGVFDNLTYSVSEDGTVTLAGQVVRPTTKSDAQARVAHLAGVSRVINRIEVLPLSSFDDDIRLRAARAIFNTGGLYRYALGGNPSIHIVVNNGRLTLEGVVATELDRRLAFTAARGLPFVFSVTNNLHTDAELRGAH